MKVSEEITIIANELANNGKQPSVALIKAKLTSAVPLRIIIDTLRGWHHEPDYTECRYSDNDAKTKPAVEKSELNQAIALALAPIQQELAEIKRQLAELKQNQQN